VSEPAFADKVVALHEALDDAGIPHAIGGALALAYYAEPRATVDVDINVFVGVEQRAVVLDALAPLGVTGGDPDTIERDGQDRLRWGNNPVDLFFSYDPFHERMRAWASVVPFGAVQLPILAPEHLLVCKAMFNRTKDWIDIDQMLVGTPDLDTGEVRTWLGRLVGTDDERWTRIDTALRELLGR
jgi:hypothetical protein